MNYEQIILAFFSLIGGGAILKFFQWFTRNNESTNAAWGGIVKDLRSQITAMEQRAITRENTLNERIEELEKLVERREELYLQTLGKKDLEILDLKDEVRALRHEVNNLRATQQITNDVKTLEVDAVKEELHHQVDVRVDKLKPQP